MVEGRVGTMVAAGSLRRPEGAMESAGRRKRLPHKRKHLRTKVGSFRLSTPRVWRNA